ncbi:hypothetical protein H8E77_37525 [bacterium]|nr:hypothetical protein [bacterium]
MALKKLGEIGHIPQIPLTERYVWDKPKKIFIDKLLNKCQSICLSYIYFNIKSIN